jgi:hypothetical protein
METFAVFDFFGFSSVEALCIAILVVLPSYDFT